MKVTNGVPEVKVGSSFNLPVQYWDDTLNQPIAITDDMSFSTAVINSRGDIIATPTITKYDQIANIGFFLISIPVSVTQGWIPDTATLDIKLMLDNQVIYSKDYSFQIVRRITP